MAEPLAPSETGVSSREAEVLALVGEHLTNAEIAAHLFISVRTVESHVSSLLRKLGVPDRRSLASHAASLDVGEGMTAATPAISVLPSPLTAFVGRMTEREELEKALADQRLVTVVGPGGVGKTRLALAVAADLTERFADGSWYVDLVPVTDPAMVAPAVAAGLGLGEQSGRTVVDTIVSGLADREALIVLDNCEHLVDGVVVFVERLLSECPHLVVLATSRVRLMVPFEWVFPIPGLSLPDAHGEGDAVALFSERAAAVGARRADLEERQRIGNICRKLDGVALAIELAAARLPTLGLDGLEAGLAEPLRMLSGGSRVDERHRSLRATLDWSWGLLDPDDRAVLRRVSVFAAPFTADDAVAVASPPADAADMAERLARLADHSLLVAAPSPGGTRYRALETIRQYGGDQLEGAGEHATVMTHHLQWCLTTASRLIDDEAAELGRWPRMFDEAADDLRAALRWASERAEHRANAHQLALRLAELSFSRGLPGEAQRRYEQAADLTDDVTETVAAFRLAAGAAWTRQMGADALRLLGAAADAARIAGDHATAAVCLAKSAELIRRGSGAIAEIPPEGTVEELLVEARALSDGSPAVEAGILTAEAFNGDMHEQDTLERATRAIELARGAGDPLIESAALDQLCTIHLARGDIPAAVGAVTRRVELLDSIRPDATSGIEMGDCYSMAAGIHLTAGELGTARDFADRLAGLPSLREEGHIATARRVKVDLFAGDLDAVIVHAERFLEGWVRAGRPVVGHLSASAYAVATAYGLRGEEDMRTEWLSIADELRPRGKSHLGCASGYAPTFDALVLLHRGELHAALTRLADDPAEFTEWYRGLWKPWYAALWAEAAVLADQADAAERIHRARTMVVGNPIAGVLVNRAAALASGDRADLLRAAAALDAAGCRYQGARTLVLAGGDERAKGYEALDALGAAR